MFPFWQSLSQKNWGKANILDTKSKQMIANTNLQVNRNWQQPQYPQKKTENRVHHWQTQTFFRLSCGRIIHTQQRHQLANKQKGVEAKKKIHKKTYWRDTSNHFLMVSLSQVLDTFLSPPTHTLDWKEALTATPGVFTSWQVFVAIRTRVGGIGREVRKSYQAEKMMALSLSAVGQLHIHSKL